MKRKDKLGVATGFMYTKDIIPNLSLEKIVSEVEKYFTLSKEEILSKDRHAEFILPRHLSYYFARVKTPASDNAIGLFFERHRTSIIHAHMKISGFLSIRDQEVVNAVNKIDELLKSKIES